MEGTWPMRSASLSSERSLLWDMLLLAPTRPTIKEHTDPESSAHFRRVCLGNLQQVMTCSGSAVAVRGLCYTPLSTGHIQWERAHAQNQKHFESEGKNQAKKRFSCNHSAEKIHSVLSFYILDPSSRTQLFTYSFTSSCPGIN